MKPIIPLYQQATEAGYEKELRIVLDRCRRNYKGFFTFSGEETRSFSLEQIIEALNDLGVDFKKVKGRKFWEIWKNNYDIKFINALSLLKNKPLPL
jgi:hypothetical protein